ncbi:MAG TPA: GNAT family N-acetyltransferase [Caulobacterales bacterium]|nr:GNAT family N-acetyltransferase [Caulobacterales bacterium]
MKIDAARVAYRNAAASDAHALADLARETFLATFGGLYPQSDRDAFTAENHTPAVMAARIADPTREFRLACLGERLVGYCGVGALKLPIDPGARAPFEIHTLYVVEAAKGAGIADALMNWALDRGRARGALDAYLGVYHANARALAFYRRHGFSIVGRYDFPVGATLDDERIMRRALA